MSVSSSLRQRIKTHGADPDDSGDDWEIGVGNLIIDLDADLEKDRQRLEMNRVLSVKSAAEGREALEYNCANAGGAAFDGLTQPFLCKEPKKFKLKRRNSSIRFPSLEIVSGIPKACVGKRREAQGRGGEMNSAPAPADSDEPAPLGRTKDGKKGKTQSKGVKREKDSAKTRKEKPSDEFGPLSENGTENLIGRGGMDAAIVDHTNTEEHSLRTLSVKTRSVGTNTQEAEKALESSYMEPCQPGTSVNLEGIVWHETEEGVLVVNVTWRKRTYVGTLLDCTKHDWAPPRFCESPMSDSEMPYARGRGKRMRLAIPDQPAVDPSLSKIRGLTHKRRGVGIGNKGRRGSLNLSGCRTPGYYAVDDIKSNPLMCGKRKGKAPADLDLNLVSDDIRNGNGKRIRAKSRSAPSTPQGKSDPVFLDQVCASPMLIDCPHPNCNKKYKHINGLRYHQSHAHLNSDRKQEFEVESEDRLSDFDEALSSVPFDSSENIISKKPRSMYKLNAVGSPKSRKALLNNDSSPIANAKLRPNVASKDGSIDDLSNLPLISNMSVVLENCLMTDRNTSVEMPKLEAEGAIDKRDICNKVKKEGFTERCLAKSRTNRLINAAPAPPKLTAIPPAAFSTKITEVSSHQASPTVALTKAKNLSLKPIKPKLDVIAQVNMANATAILSKDSKRKEKHRLKDRNCKDTRSPKSDPIYTKTDDTKSIGKDFPVSLLKEHLSKQDVVNGPSEMQESRMASIRAEADKVYTFSDNAPSPSIGSSARTDCVPLTNGDGTSAKTNSPAYSDISDAAEDGGSNSRSRRNSTQDSNSNSNINPKIPSMSTAPTVTPGKEIQSTSHGHGYESHCIPGYMHSGQASSTSFHKVASPYGRTKDDLRDLNEDIKSSESSSHSSSQSQLQYAETHTALAQSLYYGQYSRGVSMDQKVLMMPSTHRPLSEACCGEMQYSKSRGQVRRGSEQKERTKDEQKLFISSPQSIHKGANSVKINCAKPGFIYVDLDKQLSFQQQQQQGKTSHISMSKELGVLKESEDLSLESSNSKSNVDTNVTFLNASESQSWSHSYQSKYVKQQNQEVNRISEEMSLSPDKGKDWHMPLEPESMLESEHQNVKCEMAAEVIEESTRPEVDEIADETSEDSQNARGAASSPQQSFIQFQHSYPYLHLCETSSNAYRVMSPALVHNYPGFHYPLYGKTAGREDSEGVQSSKPVTDSTALELLSHPLLPYHGKSPVPGERGSPEQERETERERESVPFGRHLQAHHLTHLGMSYTLVSGQYDPFQGLSSAALVANQQVTTTQTCSSENDGKM
ncbi:zinc finger protein 608-like [Sinocyclocheilus rhinocerous]|uniref:zinc finger protein 608-like n=1 Tax=Sinocyclocheilus rhinocerous TaxID=307959 RepID=UPI0007BA603D|nr:PREDICTED: zinc finger protein 608-like [Sinocyclocheilus rhinocerous]